MSVSMSEHLSHYSSINPLTISGYREVMHCANELKLIETKCYNKPEHVAF